MDNHRNEHHNLANLIKGLHKHLRRNLRESNGDYKTVWELHAQDDDRLKSYASAMKQLATDHWSEYPESRIDWCHQVIVEYFMNGGLQKAMDRDAKHRFFESERLRQHEAAGKEELQAKTQEMDESETNRGAEQCQGLATSIVESASCVPNADKQPTETPMPVSVVESKDCDRGPSERHPEDRRTSSTEAAKKQLNTANDSKKIITQSDQISHNTSGTSNHLHHSRDDGYDNKTEAHPIPLRLLDVGSCYNPFKTYRDILPVAVDLCPAESTVLQCDFLNLDVIPPITITTTTASTSSNNTTTTSTTNNAKNNKNASTTTTTTDTTTGTTTIEFQDNNNVHQAESSITTNGQQIILQDPSTSSSYSTVHTVANDYFQQLCSPVQHLPACNFDVVVFCLLLEYLPSPLQRAKCCIKAARLLKSNGLLLIITPDSKSSHRNAPMIKSWRSALATLGLSRWKYHKKQHLHCMAFRKVSEIAFDDTLSKEKEISPLLYIPQDFTDACYDDVERVLTEEERLESKKTSEDYEAFRQSVFDELPVFCDDID